MALATLDACGVIGSARPPAIRPDMISLGNGPKHLLAKLSGILPLKH
jgi:hypothetical protein